MSLVTYAGNSRIVLTSAADKVTLHSAIDQLSAHGGTAMADGIFTAYRLAEQTLQPGHVNQVIVASDGDANIGRRQPSQIVPEIRRYAYMGITLTTLGFGHGGYQDQTMEQLANDGDGNYFFIDNAAEAQRVLVDQMTQTFQVVARDTKIQVAWNPNTVSEYRLLGYENRAIADRDFRSDQVDAGEVGAGHQVTALYELLLTDDATGPLGTFNLRFKPPGPDAAATEMAWTLPTSGIRPTLAHSSDPFKIAVAAGYFAESLRQGQALEAAQLARVRQVAATSQRKGYAEDLELLGLITKAELLLASR